MHTITPEVPAPALWRFPSIVPEPLRGCVATIGNFDGLHLGHRALIARLRREANERPIAVISFYPHPLEVLRPGVTINPLTPLREKLRLLGDLHVDLVYLLHFTPRLAAVSAAEFIDSVLIRSIGVSKLVVGRDAAIGARREGTVEYLSRQLPGKGIELTVMEDLLLDGSRAGSRVVRERLEAGDVAGAERLLGRPHALTGRVVHGDSRGRTIGFPTANVACAGAFLPKNGVYAALVPHGGTTYLAVCNIGTRPTFQGSGRRVEAHLLEFSGASLYGERLTLHLMARLRDEMRFDSVDSLRSQIEADCRAAVETLRQRPIVKG